MNDRPVPENVCRFAVHVLKPVDPNCVSTLLPWMKRVTSEIRKIVKLVLKSGIRSPQNVDALLKCLFSKSFESDYMFACGMIEAQSEMAMSNPQESLTFLALCAAILTWLTNNRVTVLEAVDSSSEANELLEFYGSWVEPVSEIFTASCMGVEMPLVTQKTSSRPRVRAHQHFALVHMNPEKSQAFLRSLSHDQIKMIEHGLTADERAEFQHAVQQSSTKPVSDVGNDNDDHHAAIMVEKSFDIPMLAAANNEQIGLLSEAPRFGALFSAAVKSAKRQGSKQPSDKDCNYWVIFENLSPIAARVQIESMRSDQIVKMLECADEERVRKLDNWMGISSNPSGFRPGVTALIKQLKTHLADTNHRIENPIGKAFADEIMKQVSWEQDVPIRLPMLILDEHKQMVQAMAQHKTVGEVLQQWIGPVFNIVDHDRVFGAINDLPI